MNAGLPTTGIGGIFYMLSILVMPIFETIKTIKGESSIKRWREVLVQFILLFMMFGAIWGTGILLSLLIPRHLIPASLTGIGADASTKTNLQILISPFAILLGLFALTQAMRVVVRIKNAF